MIANKKEFNPNPSRGSFISFSDLFTPAGISCNVIKIYLKNMDKAYSNQ